MNGEFVLKENDKEELIKAIAEKNEPKINFTVNSELGLFVERRNLDRALFFSLLLIERVVIISGLIFLFHLIQTQDKFDIFVKTMSFYFFTSIWVLIWIYFRSEV